MNRAAPAISPATSRTRVRATRPTGLGRKAVTSPQQLSRNSRGMDAGRLAVRYRRSNSTPARAFGGVAGRVMKGKTEVKRRPSGRR